MAKAIKKIFRKVPILGYIVSAFIKSLLIFVPIFGAVFGVLWFTGVYSELESRLNLGYNSPFVQIPLAAFAALAIVSAFIGILLYFHKYQRTKLHSEFKETVAKAIKEAKATKETKTN